MQFKILRENFLEGLSKVQGVVERKNTMPVLSNVLIETDKDGIKITGTDMEVAIICFVPAQVTTPGKITVAARGLYDIVREISNTDIVVTLGQGDRLEIKAGKSRFNIPGLSASEYPSLPEVKSKSYEVPCALILDMIQRASFSMSTDETRQNLAGLLFMQDKPGTVRMVATDGHRLALVEREFNDADFGSLKVIIPRKGVGELRKLVSKEGSFELALTDKHLLARKGNETLFVRLIDGDFPDYRRVIPESNTKQVIVSRDEFIGALRRVSLLSNERARGVVMNFTSGHLEISISNPELGEAREEFEADYKGEKLSVGFNARYFLDVLDVIRKDTVRILLNTELTPCVVKEGTEEGFLSVIMPMRI